MAEENVTQTQTEPAAPRTFTQEEVDALMGKVRRETRERFADYDALKAKADRYDELEEASKSALERAKDEAKKAKAEFDRVSAEMAHERLVARVSQDTGVPAGLLHGDTEEELSASAAAARAYAESLVPVAPRDAGGAPTGVAVSVADIDAIKDPLERVRARAAYYAANE